MKVTVLTENTACGEVLQAEHGLSLYVETGTHKILFDMGQTDAFARNARALGVDLAQVDIAVLSHGHYDHGGGLKSFLAINADAPVYIHKKAFGEYYNGTEKYIGLDKTLRDASRLVFTEGTLELAPGITLVDCAEEAWAFDPYGLNEKQGETFFPDSFAHEQYLLIEEEGKRILLSGCSHRGIENIVRHFRTDVFFGGLHLNKVEDTGRLDEIARELLGCNTRYYTGHCTGEKQFAIMKQTMGDYLQALSTGRKIEV